MSERLFRLRGVSSLAQDGVQVVQRPRHVRMLLAVGAEIPRRDRQPRMLSPECVSPYGQGKTLELLGFVEPPPAQGERRQVVERLADVRVTGWERAAAHLERLPQPGLGLIHPI